MKLGEFRPKILYIEVRTPEVSVLSMEWFDFVFNFKIVIISIQK